MILDIHFLLSVLMLYACTVRWAILQSLTKPRSSLRSPPAAQPTVPCSKAHKEPSLLRVASMCEHFPQTAGAQREQVRELWNDPLLLLQAGLH